MKNSNVDLVRFLSAPMLMVLALGTAHGCIIVEEETPIYDPCFSSPECDIFSDACFEITIDYGSRLVTDAMCSASCRDDFDCPFDGICLSLEGQMPICYEPCAGDFGCALGFSCIGTVGARTFETVCLPF